MKFCSSPILADQAKWPLTGGVTSQSSVTKDHNVDKVYVAGYQDGTVRIWDATCSVLKLMFILEGEVRVPSITLVLRDKRHSL